MIDAIGQLLHQSVVQRMDQGSDQHKDKGPDKMDDDADDLHEHDRYTPGQGLAPGQELPGHHRLGVCVVVEQLLRSVFVLVVGGMAGVAQVRAAAQSLIRSTTQPLTRSPTHPHNNHSPSQLLCRF